MKNPLCFDRENHRYSVDGIELPSVTTILRDCGLVDSRYFDEYSATRGSAVHLACAYFDMGDLDESSLDPAIVGYVEAYKKFRREVNLTFFSIETPLHSELYGFAGTPDRVIPGMVGGVLDIKTGQPQPWHGAQLAAYVILADKPKQATRYGLYLKADGTYKLETYRDRHDFDVWNAALTLWHFKHKGE